MNMFIMHELQLKKQISFNNRFQNSPEDTLKDACLYVLTTLEEGKTIWEKDILYVIYRYFQITHLIIKNKFSKLINDKVQQRSIIIIMYACSVGSDSLRLHGLQHAGLPCPSPNTITMHPLAVLLLKFCCNIL